MHRTQLTLIISIFALLIAAPAVAQLTWETTDQTIEVKAGDQPSAVFRCVNAGGYPLSVVSVEALDDGLRTGLGSRRTLAASAKGSVQLSAPGAGLFEPQVLRARVATDERGARPVVLTLTVQPAGWERMSVAERQTLKERGERIAALPLPLEIEPAIVMWRPGEALSPKRVTITVNKDVDPVRVTGAKAVRGNGGGFDVVVKELERGRRHELTLTPTGNRLAPFAVFRLEADLSADLRLRQELGGATLVTAVVTGRPRAALPASTHGSSTPSDKAANER